MPSKRLKTGHFYVAEKRTFLYSGNTLPFAGQVQRFRTKTIAPVGAGFRAGVFYFFASSLDSMTLVWSQ